MIVALLLLVGAGLYAAFMVSSLFIPRSAPLHKAAFEGDISTVRALLSAKPEAINELKSFWVDTRLSTLSPLMWAVRGGRLDIVKELLARGADPNLQDRLGRTALWFACDEPRPEIARYLVQEARVSPNSHTAAGSFPLQAAIRNRNRELTEMLLQAGADPNEALWYSLQYGNGEFVEFIPMLLKSGAVPSQQQMEYVEKTPMDVDVRAEIKRLLTEATPPTP